MYSFRYILPITLLIIFMHISFIYPMDNDETDAEYRADKIFGFAKYLINRDEYYRAFVELKRLNSYYPGYVSGNNLHVTELYLLFKGKSFTELLNKKIETDNQDIIFIDNLYRADVYFERSDFQKADTFISSKLFYGESSNFNLYLYKRTMLTYLLLKRIGDAKSMVYSKDIEIYNLDFYKEAIEYSDDCLHSLIKPYHSLYIGIIPGMGYAYAGRRPTGIIAFVMVSVMSMLTYYSFKTDNKPIGLVFGVATAFFYGGSIVGGFMASKKYNETVMNNMKEYLFDRMDLESDREAIFREYGIANVK